MCSRLDATAILAGAVRSDQELNDLTMPARQHGPAVFFVIRNFRNQLGDPRQSWEALALSAAFCSPATALEFARREPAGRSARDQRGRMPTHEES